MPIARANALFEKLDGGLTGIRLYGIAPPKLASDPDQLREIAAQQVARLRVLAPEGLVVYDIQDEPGRDGQARPFPFLPTVDPEGYAYDALAELAIPKIVYRCVGAHSRDVFSSWIDTVRAAAGRRLSVFVGAPRGRSRSPGVSLTEAYAQARDCPNLVDCNRHRRAARREEDEHQRMPPSRTTGALLHHTVGVRFRFHEVVAFRLRTVTAGVQPLARPIVLTFSPAARCARCSGIWKWLGISFPRWLENELRHSADTLERSVDLCESVFADVQDYAREKHLPIGINVESVSIRKSEIDASVELYRRLSARLDG